MKSKAQPLEAQGLRNGACWVPVVLSAMLSLVSAASGEDKAAEAAEAKDGQVVNFKSMTVHTKERRIEIEGKFCLDRDIVEFLVVQTGGRDYESMIEVESQPSQLKVALELIGLKVSPVTMENDLLKDVPENSLRDGGVTITLKWQDKNGAHAEPPETFLIRRDNRKAVPTTAPWVFTGSTIEEITGGGKEFGGDYHKLAVGLWYDPASVVNYSVPSKNPYWCEDCGYEINTKTIPQRGTKVTLVVTPWKPVANKGAEKKAP
jgi:hypothetical protein